MEEEQGYGGNGNLKKWTGIVSKEYEWGRVSEGDGSAKK